MKFTKSQLKDLIYESLEEEANINIKRMVLAEVKILKENYYGIKRDDPPSIKDVIRNWTTGEKPYDEEEYHGTYTIDELLEYRYFEWAEDGEQKSPEEWNKLLQDVKETGIIEPVVIYVGLNGQAKIVEGNQKVAIAQQLNIKKLPVKFVFVEEEVRKGSKMTQEPAEIHTAAEDARSDIYYIR